MAHGHKASTLMVIAVAIAACSSSSPDTAAYWKAVQSRAAAADVSKRDALEFGHTICGELEQDALEGMSRREKESEIALSTVEGADEQGLSKAEVQLIARIATAAFKYLCPE